MSYGNIPPSRFSYIGVVAMFASHTAVTNKAQKLECTEDRTAFVTNRYTSAGIAMNRKNFSSVVIVDHCSFSIVQNSNTALYLCKTQISQN